MSEEFREVEALVVKWAIDKGIYTGEEDEVRFNTQLNKLVSEVGELCDAYIKDDINDIKDSIGDCLVVLTSLVRLDNKSNEVSSFISQLGSYETSSLDLVLSVSELIKAHKLDRKLAFYDIISDLHNICYSYNTYLLECYQLAYDTIKNRTGRTTKDGNFIKDTK